MTKYVHYQKQSNTYKLYCEAGRIEIPYVWNGDNKMATPTKVFLTASPSLLAAVPKIRSTSIMEANGMMTLSASKRNLWKEFFRYFGNIWIRTNIWILFRQYYMDLHKSTKIGNHNYIKFLIFQQFEDPDSQDYDAKKIRLSDACQRSIEPRILLLFRWDSIADGKLTLK